MILTSSSILKISFSIILILSYISISKPLFAFWFMVCISGIILVLLYPYQIYVGFFDQRKHLIIKLLKILEYYNILDFFASLYIVFFCVPPKRYHLQLLLIFVLNIIYIIGSRWYYYHAIILHESFSRLQYSCIYLILLTGILVVYTRFLLNISLMIVPLTIRMDKSLLSPSVLYVFGEDSDDHSVPDKGTQKPPVPSDRKFSLLNINITRNTYKQYFSNSNPNYFRNLGLCLGICTLGAASAAAYYARSQALAAIKQADAAIKQADAAIKQVDAAIKQNDLSAFQSGLITKDQYYDRHPEDKR
jgi:hypothetical protein